MHYSDAKNPGFPGFFCKSFTMSFSIFLWIVSVRKKSKGVSVDFDEVEKYVSEGLGTGVKQHKDVENEMVLEKAFEILNKQERTIVVLHMIDGLKHREISKITGIPLSTVLSKYNRSLKKLREFIKE